MLRGAGEEVWSGKSREWGDASLFELLCKFVQKNRREGRGHGGGVGRRRGDVFFWGPFSFAFSSSFFFSHS